MIFQARSPEKQNPSRRSGLTLVEVLATIFILAVGSLSILVLFPVGAMKVKTALNNARIALLANNGISNLQVLVKTGMLDIKALTYSPALPDNMRICLFDQTAQINGALTVQYPGNSAQKPLTFLPVNFLSVPPTGVSDNILQFRKKWFSLQDDIEWDASGSVGPVVARGQAFSNAYLIRKEANGGLYEVTLLVYNGRSPNLYDSGNDQVLTLANMADAGATGNTALALSVLPNKEGTRTLDKGSWIVETTNREYEYYQIQSVTDGKDSAGNPCYRMELDRPLTRKFNQAATPEFYWVDYLGGVFPKGQLQFN